MSYESGQYGSLMHHPMENLHLSLQMRLDPPLVHLLSVLLAFPFHITSCDMSSPTLVCVQGRNLRGSGTPQNANHPDWQGNQNAKTPHLHGKLMNFRKF
jgi:hypothetical protein